MKISNYNVIKKVNNNDYILCNLLYKSIIIFSSDIKNELLINLNFPNKKISKDLLNILSENKFLIEDNFSEEFFINNLILNKIKNNDTLNLILFSTLNCNFECSYCYQHHKKINFDSYNINSIFKFIDLNIKDKKTLNLSWFGGEPLLSLNKINDVNSYIINNYSNIKFNSSIVTNGYILSNKITKNLVENLNIKFFQVTLDGNQETHNKNRFLKINKNVNTFKVIFENLINLLKNYNNIILTLRINIYSDMKTENLNFLKNFLNYKNKIIISLNPIHKNPEKSPGLLEEKTIIIKKIINFYLYIKNLGFNVDHWFYEDKYNSCKAGTKNTYFILPNSKLIICTGTDFNENNIIGQINNDGNLFFYKHKNTFSEKLSLDDECKKCKVLPLCLGGCNYIKEIKKKKSCIPQKYFLDDYINLLNY
ncbi:uncharacterized protein C7380_10492 [Oceanotoga teriensis]|uniref:Radical SAM core domain-containing protein n=1 Tax=Oceanotoga teriensis TaxID=515440 RepID=A0AA45C7T8_9BACT|nr:radical SAM protein [Oceanotoga teriensis]PWJ95677.1 uncharacterized protein C7380_10492 [Oceanotoga teriensis]